MLRSTLYYNLRKAVAVVGLVVKGAGADDPETAPSITSGAGAPADDEPDGSLYLRTDGAADTTLYARVADAWVAMASVP